MLLFRLIKNFFISIHKALILVDHLSDKFNKKTEQWLEEENNKSKKRLAAIEQKTKNSFEGKIENLSQSEQGRSNVVIEVLPKETTPLSTINQKTVDTDGFIERKDLINHLLNIGFQAYIPRTSSWRIAFISSNNSRTIYFLFGKRNIDFKYYNFIRETRVDDKGKLFTDGGWFVRNYYNESDVYIHGYILSIASKFLNNENLSPLDLKGHGVSPNKSRKNMHISHINNKPSNDAVIDLYNSVSDLDGEDAYLGDGVWISSDGSLDDRGR